MWTLMVLLPFALCVLGDIMQRSQLVKFTNELTPVKADSFLLTLISKFSDLSDDPSVQLASQFARRVVVDHDHTALTALASVETLWTHSATEVYAIRQIQALFSKREQLTGIDSDKRGAALATFDQAEVECFKTNKALRNPSDPHYEARRNLISKMSAKIWRILGPCPSLEELDLGFGPGANVGCKKNTSVKKKLSSHATATDAAGRLFAEIADHYHAWPGLKTPVAVRGSQWTSVPKTFKTDRGINIEPIINSFVQKGIGKNVRELLKREGIDLTDQTANQLLAQLGSNIGDGPGGLATIDLSMASDCIAYLLVMDLLPFDWFCLLDSARSPECKMPNGTWRILEKFSAMGNGYTFELESLIFYALLCVVCGEDKVISVYGDDLICPNEYFEPVCEALKLIGFTPNKSKSFASGPFRESCGRDFWYGTNVRPCYLKKNLCFAELFRIHNFFKRNPWIACDWMIDFIPSGVRLFGPDGFGDGHLVTDWRPSFHKGYQSAVYCFKTYRAIARTTKDFRGRYGAFLYGNQKSSEDQASLTLDFERSMEPQYRVRKLRVPAVT